MKIQINILSSHRPDIIITIHTIQMIQIIVYVTFGIYLFLNDVKNEVEIDGRLWDLNHIDYILTYYTGVIVFINQLAYKTNTTSLWTKRARFIATVSVIFVYIWTKGPRPSDISRSERMHLHVLFFTVMGLFRLFAITLWKAPISKIEKPSEILVETV